MTTKNLQIHSQNILPIIKRWLYSDRDIFARELIANATDALRKIDLMGSDKEGLRIDVMIDKTAKTLTFSDTGIGMTAEEVEKYIAQIAFSGAEEFLSHYEGSEKDQIIGHFGLGFYSAYMVAKNVEIETKSYLSEKPSAHWVCAGETEYQLNEGKRVSRGTDVILHVSEDGSEYLEELRLRDLLMRYCAFLPYPIYLNNKLISHGDPLWLKNAKECSDEEYLNFYRKLHPNQPDPLFWIHLDVDFPFTLRGILYFPRISSDFDPNRSSIKLFCNRVFVADNCKEILPEFLMPLQGALDSPDIPLNVSRSSLQMDRKVRQIAGHISKKVCDKLRQLHDENRQKFIEIWPDVQWVVKVGTLQDEKFFERASSWLIWKSFNGDWLTLDECKKRAKKVEGDDLKIYYTFQNDGSNPIVELYLSRNLTVLEAHPMIDPPLFAQIERKSPPLQFMRIDSSVDSALIDEAREKTLLDNEGKSESTKLAEFFQSKLSIEHLKIEAKSLQSEQVPAILVINEQTRRLRDSWLRQNPPKQGEQTPPWLQAATLIINTNHPIVSKLEEIDRKKPQLCSKMATHLYEVSLMAQNELPEIKRAELVQHSIELMDELANLATL